MSSFDPFDLVRVTDPSLLIVISAPSGTGKSTVCHELIDQNRNLEFSISMTTRSPREDEEPGTDYYFVDEQTFDRKLQQEEFLEWAEVHGERYGTPRGPVFEKLREGKDVLLELDVQGARQMKELPARAVLVFLIPPSMEELESRLRSRNTETETEIQKRLRNAHTELQSISIFDYVVTNRTVHDSIGDIQSIIRAEKCLLTRKMEALESRS